MKNFKPQLRAEILPIEEVHWEESPICNFSEPVV